MKEFPPSLEESYRVHRGLLVSALARLARQGFVVPPDEGLDFIHAFYADEWPRVVARFDASMARFSTYLFSAFTHFARGRVIRTWRHQRVLQSLGEARSLESSSPGPEEFAERDEIRLAMDRLPRADQQLLQARIVEGTSERGLAVKLGISRHELREACTSALGRLALALNRSSGIGRPEWTLADALWSEERSLDEAATFMGVGRIQIQATHRHLLEVLAATPKSSRDVPQERSVEVKPSTCDLWRALTKKPAGPLIDSLAPKEREELLSHLDECPRCQTLLEDRMTNYLPTDTSPSATAEEWVADLYAALAGPPAPEDIEEQKAREELLRFRQEDEARAALAVSDILLRSLRPELQKRAEGLGLPPLRVFLALEAIAVPAFNAVWLDSRKAGGRPADNTLLALHRDGAVTRGDTLILEPLLVMKGLARASGPALSGPAEVLSWICDTAQSHASAMVGFDTCPLPEDRVAMVLGVRPLGLDLAFRWSPAERRRALERARAVVADQTRPKSSTRGA